MFVLRLTPLLHKLILVLSLGVAVISSAWLHQEIFNHAAFKAGGLDIHYLERRLGIK